MLIIRPSERIHRCGNAATFVLRASGLGLQSRALAPFCGDEAGWGGGGIIPLGIGCKPSVTVTPSHAVLGDVAG